MPRKKIIIEPIKREDLSQVLAIEHASFQMPFSENIFKKELELPIAYFYVARCQNGPKDNPKNDAARHKEIVGYIDFWMIETEVYIITVAVHPDWRNQKIGSSLIKHMISKAQRSYAKTIFLDVRPSNAGALALYKKFGFEEIGCRKKYYQNNDEDALVFKLTLASRP